LWLYFDSETFSAALVAYVATTKKFVNFFEEKVHPGDLARGCSDLEMTWLLCCAGAVTAHNNAKICSMKKNKI